MDPPVAEIIDVYDELYAAGRVFGMVFIGTLVLAVVAFQVRKLFKWSTCMFSTKKKGRDTSRIVDIESPSEDKKKRKFIYADREGKFRRYRDNNDIEPKSMVKKRSSHDKHNRDF